LLTAHKYFHTSRHRGCLKTVRKSGREEVQKEKEDEDRTRRRRTEMEMG